MGTHCIKRRLYRYLGVCFFILFFSSILFAANVNFSAYLSQHSVALDETFVYILTLRGGSDTPILPQMKYFDVIGTSTSSNYTFNNGRASSSKSFEYTIRPNKVGVFTIPSSKVNIDGKVYASNTVKIKVVKISNGTRAGRQKARRGPPFSHDPFGSFLSSPFDSFFKHRNKTYNGKTARVFVNASIDKSVAYVNEQILYSFKFYRRVRLMQNPGYSSPDATGFVVMELSGFQNDYRKTIGGVSYNVSEIKTALFPTSPGEFEIGRAKLTVPGSFFTQGLVLRTKPKKIKVIPLPEEGKPKDFYGLVGNFKIIALLDKKTVKSGDPITLTVKIGGIGNIDGIQKPIIKEQPNLTIYSSKESKKRNKGKGRIQGNKTFETIIVSQKAGEYSLGKISFSFFSSDKKKYITVSTKSINFTVTPSSKEVESANKTIPVFSSGAQEDVKVIHDDIDYIKSDVKKLSDESYAYKKLWFWFLQFVPIFLIIAIKFLNRHREKMNTDVAYARLQKAGKIAKAKMKGADAALKKGNQEEFFDCIQRSLFEYIGNKLNMASAGLTNDMIRNGLSDKGVTDDIIEKVSNCLEKCDVARFASISHTREEMEETMILAKDIIIKLEKQI